MEEKEGQRSASLAGTITGTPEINQLFWGLKTGLENSNTVKNKSISKRMKEGGLSTLQIPLMLIHT